MLDELNDFLIEQGLKGTQSIGTLLSVLRAEGEETLTDEIESVMENYGLLDGQRIDTLILTMADDGSKEAEDEDD
jgi:hypothetical protein